MNNPKMPRFHSSVTAERIQRLAEACMFGTANTGICVACGEEQEGCEPDARAYKCESCGERQVYGAPELIFYI